MTSINIHKTPPFLGNQDNVVISRTGDIIYCYKIILPEKHSLSEDQYDALLDIFVKAFRNFEKNTVIHKTDFYMKRKYDSRKLPEKGFLQQTFKKHHSNKTLTVHKSFLFFSYTLSDFINRDDISNPFKKFVNAEPLLQAAVDGTFKETVSNVVEYVNKKRKAILKPLSQSDIEGFSRTYFNGLLQGVYTDVDGTKAGSKEGVKVGERFMDIYAVMGLSQLPQKLTNIVADDDISKDGIKFYQGITEPFGLNLPYDHMVNQIIYIPAANKLLNDTAQLQNDFYAARGFGLNAKPAQKIKDWLNYVQENKSTRLVKCHFNVIVFTDDQSSRDESRSLTRATFTDHDISPYLPTGNALKALYQQSFFAFSSQLPKRFTFISELRMACALLIPTSTYRSDPEGIYFFDRVFNAPVMKDTWDEKKKRIKARNFFIIAPTGEGKSTLSNHICYQYLDQGYKLCINDLGRSYQNLMRLYKDRAVMLDFKQGIPLGVNPFKLENEDRTNVPSEKIIFVNEVLNLLHYKGNKKSEEELLSHNTCLRKIISAFYETSEDLDMNTFYKFFEFIHQNKRYEEIGVDPAKYNPYEDMGKVLFSLSEFTEGIYSYLFKKAENEFEITEDTDFVYFEFDEARDDPMLLSLLQIYSYQATKKIIWDNKSVRGIQLYDEFAKQLKSKEVATSSEYIAQAIRKQNGACGFIIQSVAQLPKTDTIGSILDNTSVYYILPSGKGHHETAERLALPDHQRFLLDSIESDFSGKEPYSEVFLKLDGYAQVLRIQLPPEHVYAFQTEGHLYDKIEKYYKEFGSMETAITQLIKNK
ncbi:MAG: hypothetical protein RIB01_15225 [Balneola sp.]